MVLVKNDKGTGIENAKITVDSAVETSKTGTDGKMTLSNAYKLKKTITIKATSSNKVQTKSVTIIDNDGKDNLITMTLQKSKFLKIKMV